MPECRFIRKSLPDLLYGGLDEAARRSLEAHLASCPDCLGELRALEKTIMLANKKDIPDPGPAFWDGYWDRLQTRMAGEAEIETAGAREIAAPRRPRAIFRWAALPAAAAALLVGGILIGRYLVKAPGPLGPGPGAVVQASDLEIRTSQYLDRSKRILLALVNYTPENKDVYGLDLPGQKKASRALVDQASELKSDLAKAKERRLGKLVGDLQLILMQIANLKAEGGLDAVDVVKSGVEGRDIIFQINMAEMGGLDAGPKGKTRPTSPPRGGSRAF